MKNIKCGILLAGSLALGGCAIPRDMPKDAPKMIVADQVSYIACRGSVWVYESSHFGAETTYEVQFTEDDGTTRDISGIRHLEIIDYPGPQPAYGPICHTTASAPTYQPGQPVTPNSAYAADVRPMTDQPGGVLAAVLGTLALIPIGAVFYLGVRSGMKEAKAPVWPKEIR